MHRPAPSPRLRGEGWGEGHSRLVRSTVLRVNGGIAGDGDVVHMALAQPGAGDTYKGAVLLHVADRAVAGVAHCRAQAPDQLVDNVADRPLVRHPALDPFR